MKRLDGGGRSTFYAQTVSSRWFPRTALTLALDATSEEA